MIRRLPPLSRNKVDGDNTYIDVTPSKKALRAGFLREAGRLSDFCHRRMLMHRGDVLRADATFKVASKVRADGELQCRNRSVPATRPEFSLS